MKLNRYSKKITCIQLSGAFPDFCHRIVMPDYGMPLIGTILSYEGYNVTVFMEHVQPLDWDQIVSSDLVCMSTIGSSADKTYSLAKKIRSELRIPVILGGTHATYFPELCLEYCDYVVFEEGDETIVELCDTILNKGDVSKVAGIAYKMNGRILRTEYRSSPEIFNTIPDFSLIKGYKRLTFFDIITQFKMSLLTVQASRGCPFSCKYCIVDTMFSGGYRTRDIESVISDLRNKRKYGRKLLFVDNNFAGKPSYTKKLLKRMIEEDFGFDIIVLTRIDVASDDELLTLMRQAGITKLYQGYESIQSETLNSYDKRQTVEKITKSIEKIHGYGFRILGSFIFGADTDTVKTMQSTVQFVLEQKLVIAHFFSLWGHYKEKKNDNSPFIPRYRSIFKGWAYCDGNFVTHFPLQMRPSELQMGLINAHRTVFSTNEIINSFKQGKYIYAWEKFTHKLMWSYIEKSLLEYIPWLEKIEHGLYDSNGKLNEERLKSRVTQKGWPLLPDQRKSFANDTSYPHLRNNDSITCGRTDKLPK